MARARAELEADAESETGGCPGPEAMVEDLTEAAVAVETKEVQLAEVEGVVTVPPAAPPPPPVCSPMSPLEAPLRSRLGLAITAAAAAVAILAAHAARVAGEPNRLRSTDLRHHVGMGRGSWGRSRGGA